MERNVPISELTVLQADWEVPAHVNAFNTTRMGGFSAFPYNTLNLGLHVQDDPESVLKNRRLLVDAEGLPGEPHWLNQVHGCQVLNVTSDSHLNKSNSHDGSLASSNAVAPAPEADAAFTDQRDQVLCILTADCLPVAITNASGTKLCVAHAGWKGLVNGVLEASLAKFSNDDALQVWFGPAIGPTCFEVGIEVMDAFVSKNAEHHSSFAAHPTDSQKRYANIYDLARRTIQSSLEGSNTPVTFSGGVWCTMSDAKHFHSYRRDGEKSGRTALVAWLGS